MFKESATNCVTQLSRSRSMPKKLVIPNYENFYVVEMPYSGSMRRTTRRSRSLQRRSSYRSRPRLREPVYESPQDCYQPAISSDKQEQVKENKELTCLTMLKKGFIFLFAFYCIFVLFSYVYVYDQRDVIVDNLHLYHSEICLNKQSFNASDDCCEYYFEKFCNNVTKMDKEIKCNVNYLVKNDFEWCILPSNKKEGLLPSIIPVANYEQVFKVLEPYKHVLLIVAILVSIVLPLMCFSLCAYTLFVKNRNIVSTI